MSHHRECSDRVPGPTKLLSASATAFVLYCLLPGILPAQETADYFRQNCMSCHTIGGGRLTGPDLKNVHERADQDWLMRFIRNPRGMIESGDAYAQQIYEDSRQVIMPVVAGMNEDRARTLPNLIVAESGLEESQFKGLQINDRPFTSNDVAKGRALFLGDQDLTNGGSACLPHNAWTRRVERRPAGS